MHSESWFNGTAACSTRRCARLSRQKLHAAPAPHGFRIRIGQPHAPQRSRWDETLVDRLSGVLPRQRWAVMGKLENSRKP